MQHQRFVALLIAAAGLLALLPTATLAQQRVALVIGNASYARAPRLANPLNDAADISAALARLGFAVTTLENADYAALRQGLLAFTRAASAAEVAVVFYAGHGIEVDQRNFLVPVDARLASDQDVEFEAVPLALVTRSVARASGLQLVILDACRENPFAVTMQRTGATRSVGRGLGRVEPAGETLVAYAAKENTVALDGDGRNSPYSAALLGHLEEPGLEVGLLFRKVRDAVLAATGGRQEPFVYGSLSSRGVYLTARAEPDPTPSPGPPTSMSEPASERLTAEQLAAERVFWESVKASTNPADIQAYLDRYPGGTYEVLGRNRLKALQRPEAPPGVSAATAESVEAALQLERSEVRLIQLGLAAQGFDPGGKDGWIGDRTRTALRQWQARQKKETTGHLDAESAKLLKASGETGKAEGEARRKAAEVAQRQEQDRQREREAAERKAAEEAAARRPIGPNWIVAKNQPCQVHNPYPVAGEAVTWSGSCADGKASGEGRLVWQNSNGTHVYEGWMRDGKKHGWGPTPKPTATATRAIGATTSRTIRGPQTGTMAIFMRASGAVAQRLLWGAGLYLGSGGVQC